MSRTSDSDRVRPVTWWECTGIAVAVVAFFALRFPLYVRPGLLLGWHSDAALLGLMARAMAVGDVPLIFWASDYLAPLTSVFAVIAGTLFVDEIGPLALRLGVAIEVIAALLFFHAGLRNVAGRRASLLMLLWVAAGPAFLFQLTYAPLSAEQYFFLGSVVFWYVCRFRFVRLQHWLVLGLLAGSGWWIHRGVTFVVLPALAVIFWFDARGLPRRDILAGVLVFASGVALGYVPAIIGRLEVDQRLYAPVTPGWALRRVIDRLTDTALSDFWQLIGASGSILGILLGGAVVILLLMAARRFELRRETLFAAGIVATAFAFWIISTVAYRGAVRYIVIALPILYAFAATEIVAMWDRRQLLFRLAAAAVAVAIALALYVPRAQDASEVAAAKREQYERWGGFDPRDTLRALSAGGYRVCYADVWIAHKMEWLSDPRVAFIPHRSVNRRMVESLRLAALPGRKCFVDRHGNVRELSPAEQRDLRQETLWHMHGWMRPR